MRKNYVLSFAIGTAISIPFCAGAIKSQCKAPVKHERETYSVIENTETLEYTDDKAADDHISTVQLDMRQCQKDDAEKFLNLKQVTIPEDIRNYCEAAGEEYQICPEFLEAMAWRESGCNPDAINGSCTGVMQVSQIWHGDRMEALGVTDLTDAKGCINVAADYLSELFIEYEEPEIVLAVYNGDSKALDSGYISGYASDILEISEALERIDNK